ncbi:MAG TPA: 6-phosphofructokinase, partial [Actinomycetales bacterium]|nr:6-phosphofructokinase [Actinomycetales bacterium]
MNAAVRAVIRGALVNGAEPYAIYEGWQGAIDGGDRVKRMEWEDASSIIDKGGTIIGTARSDDFREWWGMKKALKNLLDHGIDRVVVIGGDGSLAGADEFRREWPKMLAELVEEGEVTQETADAHPELFLIGLAGSIDNDLVGTDTTIGTDTALARILAAIDQISSTAASHQRTFILEVMGRNCGYLALMSAMAGGCDYVLIPEMPPADGWEEEMIAKLEMGREAGRRESMIIVAEGAADRQGNKIDARRVAEALKERAGIEARITILGHVQRGGTPTAFDRWMSTVLGYGAAQELIAAQPGTPAYILGVRRNRVARLPLVETIQTTRAVRTAVQEGRYEDAVASRGHGFGITLRITDTMTRPPAADVR